MGKSNFNYIKKFFKKWEGGWANDKADTPTMSGITIATYRQYCGKEKTIEDLKHLTEDEWDTIMKKGYYNKMKADSIDNKSIALLCVDMCWGSGAITAIKKIQTCIGCKAIDGIVGPETLGKLNGINQQYIFQRLWQMRYLWFQNIVLAKPAKKKFLAGWLRRLNDIKYIAD